MGFYGLILGLALTRLMAEFRSIEVARSWPAGPSSTHGRGAPVRL